MRRYLAYVFASVPTKRFLATRVLVDVWCQVINLNNNDDVVIKKKKTDKHSFAQLLQACSLCPQSVRSTRCWLLLVASLPLVHHRSLRSFTVRLLPRVCIISNFRLLLICWCTSSSNAIRNSLVEWQARLH